MTQTKKRRKKARPKRTRMRALLELENNHAVRIPGEVYEHVGPLPDPDAGIAEKVGDHVPIGKPELAPLGKRDKAPLPAWTSAGWKHERTTVEAEEAYEDEDDA